MRVINSSLPRECRQGLEENYDRTQRRDGTAQDRKRETVSETLSETKLLIFKTHETLFLAPKVSGTSTHFLLLQAQHYGLIVRAPAASFSSAFKFDQSQSMCPRQRTPPPPSILPKWRGLRGSVELDRIRCHHVVRLEHVALAEHGALEPRPEKPR